MHVGSKNTSHRSVANSRDAVADLGQSCRAECVRTAAVTGLSAGSSRRSQRAAHVGLPSALCKTVSFDLAAMTPTTNI